MGAADGLGEGGADVDDAQLLAAVDLVAEGHGVGDDDLAQAAVVEDVDGVAAQDAVRDDGDDLARAVVFYRGRRFAVGGKLNVSDFVFATAVRPCMGSVGWLVGLVGARR